MGWTPAVHHNGLPPQGKTADFALFVNIGRMKLILEGEYIPNKFRHIRFF
jgi:hypothetical protein